MGRSSACSRATWFRCARRRPEPRIAAVCSPPTCCSRSTSAIPIQSSGFDGRALKAHWRVETTSRRTSDQYGIFALQLFAHAGLDARAVKAVVVSSVVPTMQFSLEKMSERFFHAKPMFVAGRENRYADSVRQPSRGGG